MAVHPTHGAGSLCSTGIASTPLTTIGFERRYNPLLAPMDVDAFARALLGRPAGHPALLRPDAADEPGRPAAPRRRVVPQPPPLSPEALEAARRRGCARGRRPAAGGPCRVATSRARSRSRSTTSFGTWLGWVVDLDRPIVLVVERDDDLDELTRQALRIGHDEIAGHLEGGFERWAASGRPVEASGRRSVDELAAGHGRGPGRRPLRHRRPPGHRVRERPRAGRLAHQRRLAAGPTRRAARATARSRPSAPAGFRASIAASLLRSAGFADVSWVAQGFPAWDAAGYPVEYGDGGGRGPERAEADSAEQVPTHRH